MSAPNDWQLRTILRRYATGNSIRDHAGSGHYVAPQFRRGVVESNPWRCRRRGTVSLCMPVVYGAVVNWLLDHLIGGIGRHPEHRAIKVRGTLDNVYAAMWVSSKIDVEGLKRPCWTRRATIRRASRADESKEERIVAGRSARRQA